HGTGGREAVSNQKVASSIPCRSVLEQDTEPLIAPDVQCAISVHVRSAARPISHGTGGREAVSNQKVASSIPCRSVLEQDTEPLIAPDVQCAISVNVKYVYIVSRTYVSRFG